MIIDGINIKIVGEELPEEEIREYIKRGREKYGKRAEQQDRVKHGTDV